MWFAAKLMDNLKGEKRMGVDTWMNVQPIEGIAAGDEIWDRN